eukprot:3687849-Rhodomonas_salina.2
MSWSALLGGMRKEKVGEEEGKVGEEEGKEEEEGGSGPKLHPTVHPEIHFTLRNQIQETAISVQFVPGMRFLVFDFGVSVHCKSTEREKDTDISFSVVSMLTMARAVLRPAMLLRVGYRPCAVRSVRYGVCGTKSGYAGTRQVRQGLPPYCSTKTAR